MKKIILILLFPVILSAQEIDGYLILKNPVITYTKWESIYYCVRRLSDIKAINEQEIVDIPISLTFDNSDTSKKMVIIENYPELQSLLPESIEIK